MYEEACRDLPKSFALFEGGLDCSNEKNEEETEEVP